MRARHAVRLLLLVLLVASASGMRHRARITRRTRRRTTWIARAPPELPQYDVARQQDLDEQLWQVPNPRQQQGEEHDHWRHEPQQLQQQERQATQTLFRHRFVVSQDFCIRMPLDAQSLMFSCSTHDDLSGYIELQLEAFRPLSKVRWSPDARRMLSIPNAGGSSIVSEVLALELLARGFGASLEKTELELAYRHGSKMTDFAVNMFGGHHLGVSVTRAYKWHGKPGHGPCAALVGAGDGKSRYEPAGLDASEARRLLKKKLIAIKESSRNVQNHSWRKQLLIVFTFSHGDAALLESEYRSLPPRLRANTVLLVTRTNGVPWIW